MLPSWTSRVDSFCRVQLQGLHVELANLTMSTLAEVIDQTHKRIDRIRRTPHLACSFLRHAGLSVC
jgi:hypothetical protein